jgi:hypothetical protein
MDRVHAGDIIAGSFGFVRDHLKSVVAWSAIFLIVTIAIPLAILFFAGPQFGFEQVRTGAISPVQFILAFIAVFVVLTVLITAIQAAIFRAALYPERREITYLRLGGDELRLFGLMLILGLLFFVGFLIAEIVFFAVVAAFFAMGGMMTVLGIVLAIVGGFALFAGAIFFVVRLASAAPLTILRKRITIGEAWRLTRGHFWTLFGSYAVIAVISFVVMMVILSLQLAFGSGAERAMLQQMMQPRHSLYQQQLMALQMQQAASFGPGRFIWAVINAIIYGCLIALQGGTVAVATRLLAKVEEPASVF